MHVDTVFFIVGLTSLKGYFGMSNQVLHLAGPGEWRDAASVFVFQLFGRIRELSTARHHPANCWVMGKLLSSLSLDE